MEGQIQFIVQELTRLADSYKVINEELGEACVRLAVLETQVAELMWMQRLMGGLVVTAIIGAILNLILQHKNNKK